MLRSETRKTTRLSINEIYASIQGEGLLIGTPSIFIRFQGCNIRCPWCDQKEALSFKETNYTLEAILQEVSQYPHKHVVITGGEPFAQKGLYALVKALRKRKYSIQIETNGTLWVEGLEKFRVHITCSPKWSASWFVHPKILSHCSEIKFVVDDFLTLEVLLKQEFRKHLQKGLVILQPEGNKKVYLEKAIELQNQLLDLGFSVKVLPQLHKLFGLK